MCKTALDVLSFCPLLFVHPEFDIDLLARLPAAEDSQFNEAVMRIDVRAIKM